MEASPQTNGGRVVSLTAPTTRSTELPPPISEGTARLLGAIAIFGVGLIHILDAVGTYHSTRWIFWAYIVLIVATVPAAMSLLHWSSPLAWVAAAAVAAGPLVAYLWSRSIGLPGDAPDIGNWLCTLGIAALFAESSLLALSAARLARGGWSR
jgi:hypothetical protein